MSDWLLKAIEHDKLVGIIKDLSLCLDEYGAPFCTHYISKQGKIEARGNFIDLVYRARDILEKEKK